MLLRTVRRTIEKYRMLERGDTIVVAISGGPDSVALIHVLQSLKSIYGVELIAAHLEHGLRGDESVEDMHFVEELCRKLGIPLRVRQENVGRLAEKEGLSIEAAARKVRYAFLEEVLHESGATKIATGHNANDQAETVLLNLLRGSGIAGLGGMRPAVEGKMIRPLIEATREEILAYLKQKDQPFRVDSSNLDSRFLRNRVRNHLIPFLEKEFNPNIVETLCRTATVFWLASDFFQSEVDRAISKMCKTLDGRVVIDLEWFNQLADIIKLFALHRVLMSLTQDEQIVTFDTLSALVNLAERSRSGSRIEIGSGIVGLKEYDKLVIGKDLATVENYEQRLTVPGETLVQQTGCTIAVEVLTQKPNTPDLYRSGKTAYFDFNKLSLPLVVRNWREGDKFVPFGLKGSKKVHDVFIDEKVPVSERPKIPIISDREGIIWVVGVRRADRAKITDKTTTILKITLKEA